MKKALLVITAGAVLCTAFSSCTGYQPKYTYLTRVYSATVKTGTWADCNKRQFITSDNFYRVGDTLRGIYCDQVVLTRTNTDRNY